MADVEIGTHMMAQVLQRCSAKEVGLEAKCRAVMRESHCHNVNWLALPEEKVFRACLAAVLFDVGMESEDGKKLVEAIEAMKKAMAWLSAICSGLNADIPDMPDPEKIPPLRKWWNESKEAKQ